MRRYPSLTSRDSVEINEYFENDQRAFELLEQMAILQRDSCVGLTMPTVLVMDCCTVNLYILLFADPTSLSRNSRYLRGQIPCLPGDKIPLTSTAF